MAEVGQVVAVRVVGAREEEVEMEGADQVVEVKVGVVRVAEEVRVEVDQEEGKAEVVAGEGWVKVGVGKEEVEAKVEESSWYPGTSL
jgi:hypothetical protein